MHCTLLWHTSGIWGIRGVRNNNIKNHLWKRTHSARPAPDQTHPGQQVKKHKFLSLLLLGGKKKTCPSPKVECVSVPTTDEHRGYSATRPMESHVQQRFGRVELRTRAENSLLHWQTGLGSRSLLRCHKLPVDDLRRAHTLSTVCNSGNPRAVQLLWQHTDAMT